MKKFIPTMALLLCTLVCFAQVKKQTLSIPWPEEYKFKVGSDEDLGDMRVVQSIPAGEQPDKWTILINTTVVKNVVYDTPAKIIDIYKKSSKDEAPNSKFTVLENSGNAKNIWVLFKVETPRFPYDPQPQSQLYYVVQGDKHLFANYVAVKEKTLTKAFTDKWTKVFKAAKLVYQ